MEVTAMMKVTNLSSSRKKLISTFPNWNNCFNNVHQNSSILATKRTPIAFSVKTPKGAILIWYSRVLSILHRDVVSLNQCNYFGLITECQVPAHEAQVTKSASQTGANDEIVGIQMLITFCSYCLICRLSLITLSLYSVVGLEFYLKFSFLFITHKCGCSVHYYPTYLEKGTRIFSLTVDV